MASVLGMLEEREAAARVRVEGVREGAAALPYTCARQSQDGAAELNWTGSNAHNKDTRASRHCSVRFASPSYGEALSSCAYNGKITRVGSLFDPHVP